ncbi:hypothetical protein P152DRAFT_477215 [Eremomyces bilateralis CBS 781.70]|uniref:Uncharacterized protein n=1 Tax=Eremomyces bilateralis CBS 781.70 TaxID=1392243 RepID=A0A6G1FRZ9_9PEZI|nr:uncharacterized protein P152DRAFT_477215 [Eremomyces bilateralis CBS 781.70]KAF1808547.1 hypothetical protein P152DRAFT_477215 [Eremomyces bilateralis CBS 781.70]
MDPQRSRPPPTRPSAAAPQSPTSARQEPRLHFTQFLPHAPSRYHLLPIPLFSFPRLPPTSQSTSNPAHSTRSQTTPNPPVLTTSRVPRELHSERNSHIQKRRSRKVERRETWWNGRKRGGVIVDTYSWILWLLSVRRSAVGAMAAGGDGGRRRRLEGRAMRGLEPPELHRVVGHLREIDVGAYSTP